MLSTHVERETGHGWNDGTKSGHGAEKNQLVLKAFMVLSCFKSSDEWVTGGELSRRAHLPQASGYRLIQTLERIGAIIRGPRGRFRPGMLLVALSKKVEIGELLRNSSEKVSRQIAKTFNLTVHIGILEEGLVTYVSKIDTPTSFPIKTQVGTQLEAYSSALGKVLLAALSREQLDSIILDGELVALTQYTLANPNDLRAELDKVRQMGFALDNRESNLDTFCVAVPIVDIDGRVIASMSASDHVCNMSPARQHEILTALRSAVEEIERKVFPSRLTSAA
jgi:DNA-binding IclR family transcriptional regulator